MVRVMRAFGANDLRNIRRDSMMLTFTLAPLLAVVVLRIALPIATELLTERYGLDITPYYPLLLSLFVLGLPVGFGGLAGFMILDERDEDTLTALRVTPASMSGYAGYRIATAVLLSLLYTLGCISLTGLAPPHCCRTSCPPPYSRGYLPPSSPWRWSPSQTTKSRDWRSLKRSGYSCSPRWLRTSPPPTGSCSSG